MKRGNSFAPIPNAHFLKKSDGARRKVCSCHTTEGSPQFCHARRCPKKCQKGDITHPQMCAHKITISNLNSSEYTCLNSLICFLLSWGMYLSLQEQASCRSVCIPFAATETGFYSGRCWEITLLPFSHVHTCIRHTEMKRYCGYCKHCLSFWGLSAIWMGYRVNTMRVKLPDPNHD